MSKKVTTLMTKRYHQLCSTWRRKNAISKKYLSLPRFHHHRFDKNHLIRCPVGLDSFYHHRPMTLNGEKQQLLSVFYSGSLHEWQAADAHVNSSSRNQQKSPRYQSPFRHLRHLRTRLLLLLHRNLAEIDENSNLQGLKQIYFQSIRKA